ncbi:sensor histidine kinase [Romeriopsis navalis]|uniref:sensor histidine kinase n=1 Tax=Romeriopsis navalis TaxID=2992132 RepID=UPI0021F83552|nr:HAMP domain-containing sensor histidine kinase [Romeriopsis navalis]
MQRRRATGRRFSTSSLQFRLTLELVVLSIVGLACVAGWAAWQMEQNLIATHKQTLDYVAARFPEQLELYAEMGEENGLERTIKRVSTSELMVWVKSPEGQLMSQSPTLTPDSSTIKTVTALTEVPKRPQIVRVGDRDIVLCSRVISVNGKTYGKLYLSQDVTADQENLTMNLWRLMGVSGLTIGLLVFAISRRIQRALQPLAQMSQIAGAISVDDLNGATLELRQAPDEILGLARSFNEMLFRLSGAWEQQRQFVGNVSHELRTPLSVIVGYLQSLLRRGDNLSPHQQQAVSTAAAEAERMTRMLQDLLDLARVDSGSLSFRQTPVMLNTLVVEVVQMTQTVTQRSIKVIATNDDVIASTDQDRLQQVLINLLDNAIKYSTDDANVELILEKTSEVALIHVRDQGVGIPLAHQKRIFERFYRVDEAMTRSRDGTGLGLAIAKSLTEGMHGRLSLRSRPGEGSEFTITLPLWQSPVS